MLPNSDSKSSMPGISVVKFVHLLKIWETHPNHRYKIVWNIRLLQKEIGTQASVTHIRNVVRNIFKLEGCEFWVQLTCEYLRFCTGVHSSSGTIGHGGVTTEVCKSGSRVFVNSSFESLTFLDHCILFGTCFCLGI